VRTNEPQVVPVPLNRVDTLTDQRPRAITIVLQAVDTWHFPRRCRSFTSFVNHVQIISRSNHRNPTSASFLAWKGVT
jgi:hypothetical protein